MPAPQASMMQQLARTKFMGYGLRVPTNWQDPSGDPAAKQYGNSFSASEKATSPGAPPLFIPASLNKYHTDAQKMLISTYGNFIDGMCSAICSAWGQWQSTSTMVGFVVAGPLVTVGQIVGPPLTPLILASAPKSKPSEALYSVAIATTIGTAWLAYTASIKSPGLPFFPAYAAVPTPVAPPMPNIPFPLLAFTQVDAGLSSDALKGQMMGMFGNPQAPFAMNLFESISFAFNTCYQTWKLSTMINNVMAIATGGTPITPIPAVGTATMLPGGIT